MRHGALALVLLLAATTAAAGPRASGTFGSEKGGVEIVDAYAYPGVSEFGDEPAIVVRLSTVPIDTAPLANALDRDAVLDQVAAESPSIQLEFDPQGRWRGSSFYIASGVGCGYCSAPDAPGVAVKLEGGAIKGTIVVKASDHSDGEGVVANLKLDVPLAAPVKAADLGAGGGEPAKAFLACQQAAARKDAAAFRAACDILEDELSYAERESSLDSFWESGLYGHPALALVNVTVTGGRATDVEAELLLAASDKDGNKHKAVVRMAKTPAGWRYRKADVEAVY